MCIPLESTGRGDLFARQDLEDRRDDLVGRRLVPLAEPAFELLLQLLFCETDLCIHLLVLCELHDEIRVARLTLADGWFQVDDELDVEFVNLGQEEQLDNGVV